MLESGNRRDQIVEPRRPSHRVFPPLTPRRRQGPPPPSIVVAGLPPQSTLPAQPGNGFSEISAMRKRKGGQILFGCAAENIFQQLLQPLEEEDPVEFQLPDWLKKPKVMPYIFIKRNIYLTKKIKIRVADDGIFCSCRPSPGTSAVCGRDCLCGMLLSCCSLTCKCGNLCVNKPFQYRPMKKMKLIETEKCGSGVVTEEDIRQGDFVIEYVGEVIDDKTCEERLWKMKHCGDTNFYLCEISRDMVIDATYKGNKSRFINHSCQPNTEMQKWTIDGEIRIGIFATRDIKRGEELTYDYQFVQFGADQDCYCGSIGCRKKLGNKPGKLKFSSPDTALQLVLCEIASSSPGSKSLLYGKPDMQSGRLNIEGSHSFVAHKRKSNFNNCIHEVVRIWSPQDKRYYGGVILGFDSYSRKHTIITEDERVENLDLSKEDWELL
ncbi:histone-lysine N-methyltransferase ASHH3-like isoform X1 [Canna indica]|uniref:Histone-lysine N-methyltransferase ASHH3-like isoform X1 n=1 Tax=Canna indica TaxID=4628 RepID=A0AAQ3QNJ2_9LILI|nr:histone-lysine N-methyltransferase ASHH3-like isoform X1 [Canna indica]